MLHITNGDLTAERLRESGLPGDILPWRDVLHEGPVGPADDDAEFARVRATFIHECGWGQAEKVLADLRARDEIFADALAQGEYVLLWFEHDLYDQLQLVQILDRIGRCAPKAPVDLICIDRHPEVERFAGLSQLSAGALAALYPEGERVSASQIDQAHRAWRALCSETPTELAELAREAESPLPFLPAALQRLVEEYPSAASGLSVTEHRTCGVLADGPRDPLSLFGQVQSREAAPFMGDWSYWRAVAGLAGGQAPLVQVVGGGTFRYPPVDSSWTGFGRQQLALTEDGAQVLAGCLDAVREHGIDRWVGGVHLTGEIDWRRRPDGRLERRIGRDSQTGGR